MGKKNQWDEQPEILEILVSAFFKYEDLTDRVEYFMNEGKKSTLLKPLFDFKYKEDTKGNLLNSVILQSKKMLQLNLEEIFTHKKEELPLYIVIEGYIVAPNDVSTKSLIYPINSVTKNKTICVKIMNLLFLLQGNLRLRSLGTRPTFSKSINDKINNKIRNNTFDVNEFLDNIEKNHDTLLHSKLEKSQKDRMHNDLVNDQSTKIDNPCRELCVTSITGIKYPESSHGSLLLGGISLLVKEEFPYDFC